MFNVYDLFNFHFESLWQIGGVLFFWLWTDMPSQHVATRPFKTGAFFEGTVPSLQVMAYCNRKAKPELTRTEQSQEEE